MKLGKSQEVGEVKHFDEHFLPLEFYAPRFNTVSKAIDFLLLICVTYTWNLRSTY